MISKVFEKVTDQPDERARTADRYPSKIGHTKIFWIPFISMTQVSGRKLVVLEMFCTPLPPYTLRAMRDKPVICGDSPRYWPPFTHLPT